MFRKKADGRDRTRASQEPDAILFAMSHPISRRRLLKLSLAGASGAILSAAGLTYALHDSDSEVLVLDAGDPAATPRVFGAHPGAAGAATPSPTTPPTPRPGLEPRPAWTSQLLAQVAHSGPTDQPLVGLTIDDGWTARDEVLAVLKDRKVRPTFFLTGRAIANDRDFIARALDGGCEIANHTMDHAWLVDKSKAYIQKDLQDFEDLVRSKVPDATTMPYMRPSGGAINQTVIDASAELGYRPILWNASTGDGSTSTTPEQMVRNALAAGPGAILITHFSGRTVAALPGIIDGLRAKGLEPVSLTALFQGSKPG